MPYVSVYVDADDILDDLDIDVIRKYLARSGNRSGDGADYSIPQKAARYTLEEAADIFRAQGRVDLAFKLEEIRTDFVMN